MTEVGEATRPAGGVEAAERTHRAAGPLLAVCGLCGGAGTSTLAFLVARAAARSEAEPVLVCDTGGPTAGLAAYAGTQSPRSLSGVADALAADEPLEDGLYASTGAGLRVIARSPEVRSEGERTAIARVLADAREIHRLTVVDCGTLARPADAWALEAASHVAWVLPATLSGVRRGRPLLDLFPAGRFGTELIVARNDGEGRRALMTDLAALADERGGPLVLVPDLPDLAEHGPEQALAKASVALEAIHSALRR